MPIKSKNTPKGGNVRTSRESALLGLILAQMAKEYGFALVAEHKFLTNRRFRFDWAIPELMCGIEFEGINSAKSRHTTLTGYTKDTEKYNLATINGWRVLRYTCLNYGNIEKDLEELLTINIKNR